MSRGTQAVLNLAALRHNLKVVRRLAPASHLMAVVKANAYGHGLKALIATLSQADALAVATLDEANQVRALSASRVLLLEGVTNSAELALAQRQQFELVVHSPHQIELLAASAPTVPTQVWLKVDTGMHRLGFPCDQAVAAWQALSQLPQVAQPMVLMSHLANADQPDDPRTSRQLERFEALRQQCRAQLCSLANSAGVAAFPASHFDWVRPGLLLYGASPLCTSPAAALDLQPLMTLESTLIAIRHCRRGDRVGYGGRYVCDEDMPIGVVAIGYGDGYPRHAVDGTPVLVGDQRCGLAGTVSMDMITIDLRPQPSAKEGDRVVLWGAGLPVEEVASQAGTIAYELLCGIGSRVRVRTRDGA